VDRLLSALEHAKKQARDAKARAKASEGVGNDTAQGLPPLPTEAEEKALAAAVKEAEAALAVMRDTASRNAALAGATAEAEEVKGKLAEAELLYLAARGDEERAKQALAALPVPQGSDPNVAALRQTIMAHLAVAKDTCLCCGVGVGSSLETHGVAPANLWQERLAALDGYLAQTAQEHAAYEAARAALTTASIKTQQAFNEGKAVLAAGGGPVPTEAVITQAEAAVQALRDKQRAVDVLKASWAATGRAREGADEAEKEAKEWKDLADACVEAVSKLLDAGVSGFVSRVQKCLPGNDQFALTLRDGERGVFQFGLQRGGVIYTAMSGAEWARVTGAIAGACIADPKKVAVVIPEERAFDPSTLHDVLVAFGHIDAQVVLTTPVAPRALPTGWSIIDTAQDQHRTGGVPAVGAGNVVNLFEAPAVPGQ
jgi:hypothetical protein